MDFKLNSQLDLPALAGQFRVTGRVQIKNVLTAEAAARIYKCLTEETQWLIGYKDGEESLLIARKTLADMPPGERQAWQNKIHQQGRHEFQFLYNSFPLDHKKIKANFAGHLLYRVYDFICSEAMLRMIRTVTSIPEIIGANAQATWYQPSNFLARHNDMEPMTSRRVAYVLNLTRDWKPDWGGYLQFYDKDGNIEEGFMPSYNTLNLFRVPMEHSVSFVPPFCGGNRLAVTGWFRDGTNPDETG